MKLNYHRVIPGVLYTALLLSFTVVAPSSADADDVVPDMPPVPDVATLDPPKNNWLWRHYNDDVHPVVEEIPPPLTDIVTPENPLKLDVFWSMRSPYSYLALQRLVWLNSNYNVDVTIRVIFPVAARTRTESGKAGSGRWYKWADAVHDTRRVGKFQGVPFRWASPDPIEQDMYPVGEATGAVTPLEKQPYIAWLTRLANAAELQGKALEFVNAVSPLIWGARTEPGEWPKHVEAAVNRIGMDYDVTIADIQTNPQKYDAVWQKNQVDHALSGHGGVPDMVFRGEPFFGQDRFDHLFWRLRQSGLTTRPEPSAPFTTKPLPWPDGL